MTDSTTSAHHEETSQVFSDLRALKEITERATKNKHELAIVLISVCILNGIDQRKRIVPALKAIGLKPGHVAHILDQECGLDPLTCKWKPSEEGAYILHDVLPQ